MWVVALSALSSAGGLCPSAEGFFRLSCTFVSDFLVCPEWTFWVYRSQKEGLDIFPWNVFCQMIQENEAFLFGCEGWNNILTGSPCLQPQLGGACEIMVWKIFLLNKLRSSAGIKPYMELPGFLQTGFFLKIFYRFRFPSSFPDLPFPFSQLPHFLFFVILEDWHGDHLFSETFTLRNASRISNSALRYTICDILSQIEVRTISYRAYCSHYLRSLATQAVLFLFHIADVFFLYLTSFQCLIFLI